MKTILYIGNHLSRNGAYPSVAESIAPHLLPELRLHLVSRRRNKLLRMADMLLSILLFGKQEQPVVIDTYSTWNFWYAVICGSVCRLCSLDYICVLHGGNLPQRLRQLPFWSRLLFGGAVKLCAPSGYLQEAFNKAGYVTDVIPNPISIENYPFKLRNRVRPRLLWVRAFDAIYNPEMAIHVLHALLQHNPHVCLCMVGPDKDGSMEKCKELAFKLGVEKHVHFTGLLTKQEWIDLSANYDIFINTTNVDNTPVSVIEAMALGLPVVCTNAGGLPYLVKDGKTGMLVPVGDTAAMVECVKKLVNNNNLAEQFSLAGRQSAEAFDIVKVSGLWKKGLLDYDAKH